MAYQWLLFCPQLPATPSSPRVTVWRRMRSAGALGLDNGLWLTLHSAEAAAFIQEMQAYVLAQGGECRVFTAAAFDEQTETQILERFRQDRAEEYAELKEQCADFLAEIEKETRRNNFSFAEYEENEQDLGKLETWFNKVRLRDFLGGDPASEAEQWLERCREVLQQFADAVYQNEDPDHAHKMRFDPGALPSSSENEEA